MPTEFFGRTYLDTTEAAEAFHVSKQYFSKKVRHSLNAKRFNAQTKPWYAEEEVELLRRGESVRIASVSLYGIQSKWAAELERMGYTVERKITEVQIEPLPEDARKTFNLPAGECVKRGRVAYANGTPICYWHTWYAAELTTDIPDEQKRDDDFSIVDYLKEQHGLVVGEAIDRCTSRTATFEELSLFHLINNDPVFVIRRPCYTKDGKVFLFYTHMVLLGSWFEPTYKYPVHIWD